MEPAEGVKISTTAKAITVEIITSCDIDKKLSLKRLFKIYKQYYPPKRAKIVSYNCVAEQNQLTVI